MKEFISYFYGISIDNISKDEDKYIFYYNNNLYMLILNTRSKEEINDIKNIVIQLKNSNKPVSEIIYNKNGEYIFEYDGKNYILIKINSNISTDIDLLDVMKLWNSVDINKKYIHIYRNGWGKLWEEKNDYFEYQIKELGHDKPIILNSFSYYIGLSENAISIANYATTRLYANSELVLSHKRTKYPNMEIDFYNPLNYIIDLRVRDIAEYLKNMFFKKDIYAVVNELKKILNMLKLNTFEANMLYARLIYPTYYFDVYENVIENKIDEEELLSIINKADDYELFLEKCYKEINKMYYLEKIEWIVNKKKL